MSNNIYNDWTKDNKSATSLNAVGQWKFNRSVGIGRLWLRVSPGGSATVQFKDRTGAAIGDQMVVTTSADTGVYVTGNGKNTAFFLLGDVLADLTALSDGAELFAEVHT